VQCQVRQPLPTIIQAQAQVPAPAGVKHPAISSGVKHPAPSD
jgi:hypothetical protein